MFYKLKDSTRQLIINLLGNLEPSPLSFAKMQAILQELNALEEIKEEKTEEN